MKKIILIILMMFPFFVNGACDNNLREEGKELATHITNEIKEAMTSIYILCEKKSQAELVNISTKIFDFFKRKI